MFGYNLMLIPYLNSLCIRFLIPANIYISYIFCLVIVVLHSADPVPPNACDWMMCVSIREQYVGIAESCGFFIEFP